MRAKKKVGKISNPVGAGEKGTTYQMQSKTHFKKWKCSSMKHPQPETEKENFQKHNTTVRTTNSNNFTKNYFPIIVIIISLWSKTPHAPNKTPNKRNPLRF